VAAIMQCDSVYCVNCRDMSDDLDVKKMLYTEFNVDAAQGHDGDIPRGPVVSIRLALWMCGLCEP
jgi:hypothetical protein